MPFLLSLIFLLAHFRSLYFCYFLIGCTPVSILELEGDYVKRKRIRLTQAIEH